MPLSTSLRQSRTGSKWISRTSAAEESLQERLRAAGPPSCWLAPAASYWPHITGPLSDVAWRLESNSLIGVIHASAFQCPLKAARNVVEENDLLSRPVL